MRRVAAIADVDVALRVGRDRMRRVELVLRRRRARAGELRDEAAVLVVLHDARVDVAVGDEDVALRIPRHVGRPSERYFRSSTGPSGVVVCVAPATGSGRRPSTITTRPAGLNLMTMFVPSSTTQTLSSRSTRT